MEQQKKRIYANQQGKFLMRLPDMSASTGYAWQFQYPSKYLTKLDYTKYEHATTTGQIGGPMVRTVYFEIRHPFPKKGVVLKFWQQRPWLPRSSAISTQQIRVLQKRS